MKQLRMIGLAAAAGLALMAAPAVSSAQPANGAGPSPQPVMPQDVGERSDLATVSAAEQAVVSGGAPALTAYVPDLQRIMSHMPNPYSKIETHGSRLEYHADSLADFLLFSAAPAPAGVTEVVWTPAPYGRAGFLLGYYYDDNSQTDQAILALNAGLVAEPTNPSLLGERGAALNAAHRYEDGLLSYVAALKTPDLSDKARARMLRGEGYALTELNRLDEAEQAYRASLGFEPDNPLALNELKYIAGLKAGAAPAPGGIIRSTDPKP